MKICNSETTLRNAASVSLPAAGNCRGMRVNTEKLSLLGFRQVSCLTLAGIPQEF